MLFITVLNLEQKIGECLGLEMAAQKAVEELASKELLEESGMLSELQNMKKEAGNHQSKLEQQLQKMSGSLDSTKIQEAAQETEQKASEIMKIYLGEDPDSSEAIEFLCLAEGGEVTRYEVLTAIAKRVKLSNIHITVNSILRQEQKHLKLCTKLAKEVAAS